MHRGHLGLSDELLQGLAWCGLLPGRHHPSFRLAGVTRRLIRRWLLDDERQTLQSENAGPLSLAVPFPG